MSGLDLLTKLLTAYKFTLPLDQIHDDANLQLLSDLGLIEYRSPGRTVLCDACDVPHSVQIAIDPIIDKLGWRCREAGFVEVNADQLKAARLMPEVLAAQIADALRCQRRKNVPLVENLLWNIGWYEFQTHDVNVYLASGIRDVEGASAISRVLQLEPGLRNGLVIAPGTSEAAGLTIAQCRFAEFGDVISIKSGGLSCDQSRIAKFAGVAVKTSPGRLQHKMRANVADMIRQFYDDGRTFRSKLAAVAGIQEAMTARDPDLKPPGRTVIESEIDTSDVGCFLVEN